MDKFSSTEKIQAVKRYLDGTESGKTIAKSIGVTPVVLYEWIRRYESSGKKAFERATDQNKLLIHSDQGWHYQMKQYRHSLKNCGIIKSILKYYNFKRIKAKLKGMSPV
ncbi:hypothetical protein EXW62_09045 [Bacillus mycoides]|uniref:transposase n=1 Tax=Bacillus sp. FSL R9-9410 TaxID=2921590 RepID=UPI001C320DA2|nr:transposase [Bacillus mycoides]QWH17239.1 hypothetical protein EXW62_09045 [Bacillus mycoides]